MEHLIKSTYYPVTLKERLTSVRSIKLNELGNETCNFLSSEMIILLDGIEVNVCNTIVNNKNTLMERFAQNNKGFHKPRHGESHIAPHQQSYKFPFPQMSSSNCHGISFLIPYQWMGMDPISNFQS